MRRRHAGKYVRTVEIVQRKKWISFYRALFEVNVRHMRYLDNVKIFVRGKKEVKIFCGKLVSVHAAPFPIAAVIMLRMRPQRRRRRRISFRESGASKTDESGSDCHCGGGGGGRGLGLPFSHAREEEKVDEDEDSGANLETTLGQNIHGWGRRRKAFASLFAYSGSSFSPFPSGDFRYSVLLCMGRNT